MVAGAFPLAKLGFLVLKQISKPIANSFARRAKSSRVFREYVCIPVAQLFHWYDVKVRMRILNLGKVTTIPKLDEKRAIETGSQLLSEFIILGVGAGVLVFEYMRQAEKEEQRLLDIEREKDDLQRQLMRLELSVDRQAAELRNLNRFVQAARDQMPKVAKLADQAAKPPPKATAVQNAAAATAAAVSAEEAAGEAEAKVEPEDASCPVDLKKEEDVSISALDAIIVDPSEAVAEPAEAETQSETTPTPASFQVGLVGYGDADDDEQESLVMQAARSYLDATPARSQFVSSSSYSDSWLRPAVDYYLEGCRDV